jgi:CheY-like chemotaxis protein
MVVGHGDIPAPTSFDVNDLIRATVPSMVEQEAAVTLSLRLSEPPTSVHMDPTQFAEVLRALTINAIEAMPLGGTITIVASRARNRPTALRDGEFVHISVVDNGRGRAAESLDQWAGLGLATTCGIVNQAGGLMSIAAAPDAGATVHVYVPSGVAVRQSSLPGDERIGHSRGTLLIVDDNQDLRILATRMLTKAGFEVLTAADGVDAMAILQVRTFDCLVTDIAMPDMGGVDLAKSALAVDPNMPILFVSGFVNIPWGPGGLLPDNAHSLTKPYTAEALESSVRRAIRARSLQAT